MAKELEASDIKSSNRQSAVGKAFQEITLSDNTDNPFYLTRPWNPDELYQVNGDYSTYEEMREDDQISSSLQLKKDLILGSGFKITSTNDSQDEIIEDLEKVLNQDLDKPFLDYVEEMLDFEDMGFSITEKIYKKREDMSLTLKDLRTRHPGSWLIHTDPKGNILKYEQRGAAEDVFIKPSDGKLVHLVNKPKYLNPYGTSALRPAYIAWISKKESIKYYDMYLETAASPKPVGKYPLNSKDGIAAKLARILKSFQGKTSIVIPKEVEVEFLEAKTNGEAFKKAIDLWNTLIGRALLIPDLMGFTGSETSGGSFSLGKEQIDIHFKHIGRKRKALEDAINKQILKPIIMWNWGEVDDPPLFEFLPISDDEISEHAKLYLEAIKAKVWKATEDEVNHFRKLIKFPEGEVEFPEPSPMGGPFGSNPQGSPDDDKDGQGKPENNTNEKEKIDELQGDEKRFAKDDKFKEQRELDKEMHKKTDFNKAASTLDSTISKIVDGARPLISEMLQSALDQAEKKKVLQKQNLSLIDTIKYKNLKKIQLLMKKEFKDLHKSAGDQARTEIFAKSFAASSPLMDDAFLAVIEDETFTAIGDWKDTSNKKMKVAFQEAIKNGAPLSSVIPILEDEIGTAIETSINRWARTKSTEVFNKGRLAFFDSTGIVTGYQYSAIMDDRTTVICAGLHGKRFRKGEQPNPPQHFNCRSVLIPLTQFEEFAPDTKVGGEVMIGGFNAKRTKENFPKSSKQSGKPGIVKIPSQDIQSFIKDNTGKGFDF